MKKLGILLIAVIALFSIVAVGCGGGEEATPTPTPTEAPGATVAPGATATPEATAEPTSPPQPSGELGDILGKVSDIDSVTYDTVVTGTTCEGDVQGTFAQKLTRCSSCDFFLHVVKEERPNFVSSSELLKMLEREAGTP